MKVLFTFLVGALLLGSCSGQVDNYLSSDTMDANGCVKEANDSLVIMPYTEELRALNLKLKSLRQQKTRVSLSGQDKGDDYFGRNIQAIEEVPFRMEVRGTGKDKSKKYLYCDGAGQEVKLSNKNDSTNSAFLFYLKIQSIYGNPTVQIYSLKSKTPLTVGFPRKQPNVRVLLSGTSTNATGGMFYWNLLPADTQGFFGIENNQYLGQTDPNNYWTTFNYALEVNDNNEIRYGQYKQKAQQEFLIKPAAKFSLKSVTFDLENAKITDGKPLKYNYQIAIPKEKNMVTIKDVPFDLLDEYTFIQDRSNIRFNINDPMVTMLPTVVARKLALLDNRQDRKIYYKEGYKQTFLNEYNTDITVTAHPQELTDVTILLTTYNVETTYTATAQYNGKTIKFAGIWKAYIIADPLLVQPTTYTRTFNSTTGEETFHSEDTRATIKFIKR